MATFGDDSLPPIMRLIDVKGQSIALFTRYVDPGPSFIGVAKGAKGLEMPRFDVQTDAYPTLDGEFIRYTRGDSREIFLPIVIYGINRRECVLKKRALRTSLNPKLGTVKLVTAEASLALTGPGDTGDFEDEREIELYYSHGFEGDEGGDNGLHWMKVGLVFKATYPYFRGTELIREVFQSDTVDPVPFFAPPMGTGPWVDRVFRLSQESTFVNSVTINNPGDVDEYPEWRIIGPLRGPFQLVRISPEPGVADQVLQVTNEFELLTGDVATINTRPGEQGITSTAGDLTFEAFGFNPNFWALQPGDNVLEIRIPEFEEGTTIPRNDPPPQFMEVTFKPTFLGM